MYMDLKSVIHAAAGRRTFTVDLTQKTPVGFFVKGDEYKLFGLIPGMSISSDRWILSRRCI